MIIKVYRAKNIFEKIKGLMFKKKIYPLYFETRWGIHTFGVRKPILVLILDEFNKVRASKVVGPNKIFTWNPKYKKVIELPPSLLKNRGQIIGKSIELDII